jgi:hypothetical protein
MSHGEMEGDGVDVAWLLMILNLTTLPVLLCNNACLSENETSESAEAEVRQRR